MTYRTFKNAVGFVALAFACCGTCYVLYQGALQDIAEEEVVGDLS